MENAKNIDFSPVAKSYHTSLKRFKPIISRTREKQLIQKAKKGDSNAQNELLTSNLRFVFNMAKKYRGYGVSMEELISEGNMALLYAIDKFDVKNSVKFITYAGYWVRYYMSDFIKKKASRSMIEKNEDIYMHSNYKSYEDECIVRDNEDELVSNIDKLFPEPIPEYTNEKEISQSKIITELLDVLNDRERKIIECYFGLGNEKEKNLEEISQIFNISKERIRQIKSDGLMKMKAEAMMSYEFDGIF